MRSILALLLLFVLPGTHSSAAVYELNDDFQHAVVLRTTLIKNKTEAFCSGVVVNSKTVLTTAHCVDGNSNHAISIQKGKEMVWVKATSAVRSKNYDPKKSFSNSDIGVLTFNEELPFKALQLCEDEHGDEIVTQVGLGLRNGVRNPTPIYFKADALKANDLVQEVPDALAVMGDSGAPIFAFEHRHFCLYAIHSSVSMISDLKPGDLQKSFNPIIRRTALPVKLY